MNSHCKTEKTVRESVVCYVGLDIAKDRLDYTRSDTTCEQVPNVPSGHERLLADLRTRGAVCVVCEATGGYERPVVAVLCAARVPVCVVQPSRVRSFARAEGLLAKTDRLDAQLLRRFGERLQPRQHVPADREVAELRELLDYRRQIGEQLSAVRNRLELAGPILRARLKRQLAFLEKELSVTDRLIKELIESSEPLSSKAARIQQLQGAGPVLAATLLAYVPELGTIGSPQLAALVGVAPFARDSGRIQRARMVRGGRTNVRHVLYMAAVAATQHNPVLGAHYRRLVELGKPKMVAIVAVMRKMLHVLNRLIADPQFSLVR
jgi:transposase